LEINYFKGKIRPEEVIKFLALTGQFLNIFFEIIKYKEVLKKAKELGMSASDEQLQEFADQYRTTRGLYSSDEMLNFLKSNGLTEDDFEDFCEATILLMALKNHLATEKKIEEYFINNRPQFDLARISILLVKGKTLADELLIQLNEEGEDFHQLARKHSIDEATRYLGGYIGNVSRSMLSPEISAKVFNSKPGDVLGPFEREDLFQLILVEEVMRAELNDDVKEAIRERILGEWVSQFLRDGIKINL
jgi:parvulin-like peptidyl-prolyl isomerase